MESCLAALPLKGLAKEDVVYVITTVPQSLGSSISSSNLSSQSNLARVLAYSINDSIVNDLTVSRGVPVNFQQLPNTDSAILAFHYDENCLRNAGLDDKFNEHLTSGQRQEYVKHVREQHPRVLRVHNGLRELPLLDRNVHFRMRNAPLTLVYRYEPDMFALNRLEIRLPYVWRAHAVASGGLLLTEHERLWVSLLLCDQPDPKLKRMTCSLVESLSTCQFVR